VPAGIVKLQDNDAIAAAPVCRAKAASLLPQHAEGVSRTVVDGSASPKGLVRQLLALCPLDDWNDIPDDLRQMILKALAG
jgi:hypothetical protein